jgi:DNA-binding IclR family transcriptional regulator
MENGSDRSDRAPTSAMAVERASDVLFLLAEHGEASVTELARWIGSSGSAVHRILTALRRKGLVEQDAVSERYSISWAVLTLARPLAERADVRRAAYPHMLELRDLTQETVTLSVLVGDERVCVEQVESPHEMRWRTEVGLPGPLYAGAAGKVLLAQLGDDEIERYLAGRVIPMLTPYTTTDPSTLLNEICAVREHGYAISVEERLLGMAELAGPISDGRTTAAIAIGGPVNRCTPDRLEQWVELLKRALAAVSETVHGPPPPLTFGHN